MVPGVMVKTGSGEPRKEHCGARPIPLIAITHCGLAVTTP
jgi:hypothetical protein